jgi:hypothetical protein
MVPEQMCNWHFVHTSVCFLFLFVLPPLVSFFLWLPEEVLTLLFRLHCENGDFSILMKDIYTSVHGYDHVNDSLCLN